jgi:hypothetical protein
MQPHLTKCPASSGVPIRDQETAMNGEPQHPDDLFLGVTVTPTESPNPDQAAIDQVLRLVAEYHLRLGAELGRSSASPSLSGLRRSPLGRKLRRLAAVAQGTEDAATMTIRRDADDVVALLLRPLAATDYHVPAWFWQTSLGRLIAAAVYRTYRADDLFCPSSAAERLNLDPKAIDRWLDDGTLDSVRDETGARFVPVQTIERLRDVARILEGPSWSRTASQPDRVA